MTNEVRNEVWEHLNSCILDSFLSALPPHPGPTVVELRVLMKIISFLDVHCKYTVYAKWGCEPFWKAFPPISRHLSNCCATNCTMRSSSLATECARKISPESGN